jgi:hypothetical protein
MMAHDGAAFVEFCERFPQDCDDAPAEDVEGETRMEEDDEVAFSSLSRRPKA